MVCIYQNISTSPPAVNMPLRFYTPPATPRDKSKPHFAPTPAYLHQLRDAANKPNGSTGQAEPIQLGSAETSPSSRAPDTTEDDERGDGHPNVHAGHKAQLPPSSMSVLDGNGTRPMQSMGRDALTAWMFTLTSILPRLVASSGGYDEHGIATTCRVP